MLQLSVVLTAYNRALLLDDVLLSIACQTLPRDEYELIVVDDGSIDNTRSVVESYATRLPLQYVYQPNAGLATAKNHGLALSKAPLVLFVDDDDTIEPQTLRVHVDTHNAYPDRAVSVLGFTKLRRDIARSPLMHFATEIGGYLFYYRNVSENTFLGFDMYWGGRTSSKRDFLLENGGFNPVFLFGCEDVELGYRMAKKGLKVVYNPQAVSTTIRLIEFDAFCNRLRRQGSSQYVFSRMWQERAAQEWCEIPMYEADWPAIEPRYHEIMERARSLDKWATQSMELGLECDRAVTQLLHQSYYDAFKASKLAGIAEGDRNYSG